MLDFVALDFETANNMVENVVGTFSLPFSVVPNFVVDKKSYLVPMVTEEPSVVAACSNAGKIVGTKQALTAGALTALRLGGFGTYKMAVVVANAVAKSLLGRGLTFAGNATLTRTLGVALGPIGWIITALWTAIDIASPAYRVTIPCVIQVAYMRLKFQEASFKENNFSNEISKEELNSSDSETFNEVNKK